MRKGDPNDPLIRGLMRQLATRDLGQRMLDGENALITNREALEDAGSGCRLDDAAMFVLDVAARQLRSRCLLFQKLRDLRKDDSRWITAKELAWRVSKERYATIKIVRDVWRESGGQDPAIYWHRKEKDYRGNLAPFVREWFSQAGAKIPELGTIYDSLRPGALPRRKEDRKRKRNSKRRQVADR